MKKLQRVVLIFVLTTIPLVAQGECLLSINDVLLQTIENQWVIQTGELNVDTQLGLLQQATGAFNPELQASITSLFQQDINGPLGGKTDSYGRVTSTNVSLQKLSRIGTVYSVNYSNTNVLNPVTLPLEPPYLDTSTIGFSVTQPLLRNFLYSPTTIAEQTQYLEYESSRLQSVETIAESLAVTLTRYWDVVAAQKVLKARQGLEERLSLFASYAEALVAENQAGRASLHQPYANLATAVVNRIQAEQDLRAAYNALVLAMGNVPEGEGGVPCGMTFEEPALPRELKEFDCSCFESLLCGIHVKRPDLAALYLLEESASLALKSALNGLLPLLNVTTGVQFLTINGGPQPSGIYGSSGFNQAEKDYSVGLSLSYPICNDIAKGFVRQQKAALGQARLNTDQQEAQVVTGFKTAFTFNNALVKELVKARFATEEFKAAAETEFLKLQVGLSSYFDVLNLQNDSLSAELQEIAVERLYLQNMVQLFLLSGNLVRWRVYDEWIDIADIHQLICGSFTNEEKDEQQCDSVGGT